MKLYGHPLSLNTRKVLLALAEKERAIELVQFDLAQGDQRRRAHLARHPFGKVPVLEDQGFWLYESAAILRYLDATLPGTALTPSDPKLRARVDQWLSVEGAYLAPALWKLTSQLLLGPRYGQAPDPSEVADARHELAQTLDALESALEGRTYLVEETFSLAEVSIMPSLELMVSLSQRDLIVRRQHVASWWERLRVRASWRSVLAGARAANASAAGISACA